jgi:hypothetical protein
VLTNRDINPTSPDVVYDSIIRRIEDGEDVTVDARHFDIAQLMMLARAAFSHDVKLRLMNGPFRVEEALAVRRAGRGHVEHAGQRAA